MLCAGWNGIGLSKSAIFIDACERDNVLVMSVKVAAGRGENHRPADQGAPDVGVTKLCRPGALGALYCLANGNACQFAQQLALHGLSICIKAQCHLNK